MKRFIFRLQKLLEIRQAKEDRLMAELAVLRREEADEIARLSRLVGEFRSACASLEKALRESEPAEDVARWDEYVKTRRDDIHVQELTIEAVRSRVQAKLAEVVEAMKERKVLESLRDRQQTEYLAAEAVAEQNQLDEIASVRYARRM